MRPGQGGRRLRLPVPAPGPERMDAVGVDEVTLGRSLSHLASVNRWLGGRRALLLGLREVLPAAPPELRILDVGAGGGDLARVAARWALRRGSRALVVAVEPHPTTLALARRDSVEEAVRFLRADGRHLPFHDGAFHAVVLFLTLHHVPPPDQASFLREAGRVAGGRVLLCELERGWPNYLGATLLARTLWRRNPITRHDGPVSVLRGFRRGELVKLARAADLPHPRVRRRFFFRLVLTTSPRSVTGGSPAPGPREAR